jgi:phospholipid transport system substrate-binding protein
VYICEIIVSEKKSPENVILSAANNLFLDVEQNKELYEDDITEFYDRVDNILAPIIDFDTLIKSIIGKKNYIATSDELKNRFKIALKNQLIRIYAKTIVEYSKSKITIISSTKNKAFYIVKTELSIGTGKPPFQVIYVMKDSEDRWKIVEVVANGLRLVKSLRKSLLPEIEEKGIESVINRLESEA